MSETRLNAREVDPYSTVQEEQEERPVVVPESRVKKKNSKQRRTSDRQDEQVPPPRRKTSRCGQLRLAYEKLVKSVIRPPRAQYEVSDLGSSATRRGGVMMERTDFSVRNNRNESLAASLWRPLNTKKSANLIVYLHSNSSCRLAALRSPALDLAASAGGALLAFDFAACGRSDGAYVTLGIRESEDISVVLNQVLQDFSPKTKIILWGRSMGAVAALLYQKKNADNYQIKGLILDSPFSSIKQLVEDLRKRALPKTPRCCVACVFCCLRRSAKKRAHVDVMGISVVDACKTATAPALFLAANSDALAPPNTHAKFLAALYAPGLATLLSFDGEHNSPRPKHVHDAILRFILHRLTDETEDDVSSSTETFETPSQVGMNKLEDTRYLREEGDDIKPVLNNAKKKSWWFSSRNKQQATNEPSSSSGDWTRLDSQGSS